jgi:hypothetical protein
MPRRWRREDQCEREGNDGRNEPPAAAIDIGSGVAAHEARWPTTTRRGLVQEASSTAARTWSGAEGILDNGVTVSERRYVRATRRLGHTVASWGEGGEWIGPRSGTGEAEVQRSV